MLEETPRSLRLYFGIVSAISLFASYAAITQARGSLVVLGLAASNITFGVLFGYIVFGFSRLLLRKPKFIKGVLIGNFVLSLIIFLLSSVGGLLPSAFWRFLIAVAVFVYLMKSVTRLSAEALEEAEPIQSVQTTAMTPPPSATPPAPLSDL